MSGATPGSSGPAPSRRLPWRFVAIISALLVGAVLITPALAGPHAVAGAAAGVIAGFFGTAFGSRWKAAAGIVIVLAATSASILTPDLITLAVIIPAMAALVGWEAGSAGSRTFAMSLFAWIVLVNATTGGGGGLALTVAFAAWALIGIIAAMATGAEALVPARPGGRGYGFSLFVGLACGLVLAFLIARLFEDAHTHWIALMVALRSLDAPGTHSKNALRTGAGAILGAVFAGVLLTLPLHDAALKISGVLALLLGLRLLPARSPASPALISAGIILAFATSMESALFRVQAAIIAAALAMGLAWLAGQAAEAAAARFKAT